jgi:hypothetical protein
MQPDDLLRLNALNTQGQPVPLSAFATTKWITGPMQTMRYNGYPAMSMTGDAGRATRPATRWTKWRRLAAKLPAGFAFEWTGQSREEILSGSTVFVLIGFALLAVFLALAALYESWSIPVAVLLVVPLGVLGALLAATMRALSERRVLQGRPDHHHRPGGEERGPDHRVRQGPAGAGQVADGSGDRGGAPALPSDHHDLAGLHPRRAAAGDRRRRRRGIAARHRYRRDGRHDHRDRARRALRARVLRRGPQASSRAANASARSTRTKKKTNSSRKKS